MISVSTRLSLFILHHLLLAPSLIGPVTVSSEATNNNKSTTGEVYQDNELSCFAGEQRYFNYESSTKIWGSGSGQEVRLRATLRLRCMESTSNGSLRYLAEVMRLVPLFGNGTELEGPNFRILRQQTANGTGPLHDGPYAEPVFEEVGEAISDAARRVRRSVSGWFNKTWSSVKDFFSNIFSPVERSLVDQDQALNESGLANALCKSGGARSDRTPPGNLAVDDSIFNDLDEDKLLYYAGASLGDTYELSGSSSSANHERNEHGDAELSFFDDPVSSRPRFKRATGGNRRPTSWLNQNWDQEQLIRLPFVFVQSKAGKIVEIRFSSEDTETSVKNFKRHLCDLFATNLDQNKNQLQEATPVGQHTSNYVVDRSVDSSAIKQTLAKEVAVKNELVRALASVQANKLGPDGYQIEGRDPSNQQQQAQLQREQVSILRTINATNPVQINSALLAPQIDRMRINVRQVQQISAGRMTASAGHLSMSLVKLPTNQQLKRQRRSPSSKESEENIEDIAELLQVFSSFHLQLVPLSRVGKFSTAADKQRRAKRAPNADKSEPFVSRSRDLAQTIESMRQLEKALLLQPAASLVAETSSPQEGQMQRLEALRDQVQLRLGEELLHNKQRLRDKAHASPLVAEQVTGGGHLNSEQHKHQLGLSLTQLILSTGSTGPRKGSIYATLEEILELENAIGEERASGALNKLLRDTVRLDKLRSHCKAAMASSEEIRAESSRLVLFWPFDDPPAENSGKKVSQHSVDTVQRRHKLKLAQCKQVAGLLLQAGDRQAAELLIDLIDETNRRLLAAAKDEELGYGPVSRYYRNLRQQFTELLATLSRPSDALLDKLLNRLSFISDKSSTESTAGRDFDYVNLANTSPANRYNKSLLAEEDDFNNSDQTGSLLMTVATLTSKPSVSRAKRANLIDRILISTRNSQCLALSSPDIDILESMGLFLQPHEEIVGRVLSLARKCRHLDQYLVSSVHALQGQLQNVQVQRFFNELLRSTNSSCTVKSEILLTLIQSIWIDDLRQNGTSTRTWPSVGRNQIDETLNEMVISGEKRWTQDNKCLKQLVANYQFKKRLLNEPSYSNEMISKRRRSLSQPTRSNRRLRREVGPADFWDEAECKRWSIGEHANSSQPTASPINGLDQIDDDNSLVQFTGDASRTAKSNRPNKSRPQRFADSFVEPANQMAASAATNSNSTVVRRRHKCSASKRFGPKNAQAILKAELVNDLIGLKDENKFLARFRLGTNFMGQQIDVGRMYLWHQRRTTRALVNILGKSLWDTSHSCLEPSPKHFVYMPLFDFNLWLVKMSVGLRLQAQMGFFGSCPSSSTEIKPDIAGLSNEKLMMASEYSDQLELSPSINLRASAEVAARFVVVRAGASLASQYGYLGNVRVSRQPDSCMSIESGHQPMNVTFATWFQLWDGECHYWGSRNRGQPQATKWRLGARKPTTWIRDECLVNDEPGQALPKQTSFSSSSNLTALTAFSSSLTTNTTSSS